MDPLKEVLSKVETIEDAVKIDDSVVRDEAIKKVADIEFEASQKEDDEDKPEDKKVELSDEEKQKQAEAAEAEKELADKKEKLGLDSEATEEDIQAKEKELLVERAKKVELGEDATLEDIESKEKEVALKEYADTQKISLEEAKEELDATNGMLEKFELPDNDKSRDLVRSTLILNKHVELLKAELEQTKEQIKGQAPIVEIGEEVTTVNGKQADNEKLVAKFRENNPKVTEDKDDREVLGIIKKAIEDDWKSKQTQSAQELGRKARDKRILLKTGLSIKDKRVLKDVEGQLDNIPDAEIIDKDFSLRDVIRWAKGGYADENTKAEYKRGYEEGLKKGKEDSKILGELESSSSKGTTPIAAKGPSLSDAEKKEAMEMFSNAKSEKERERLYQEYKEDYKKKYGEKSA